MKHVIEIINPVEARCGKVLADLIKDQLSYTHVTWKQGLYRKERKESKKSIMYKDKVGYHYFWAGLVQRVTDYCIENGIDYSVVDRSIESLTVYEADLPGITFKPSQIQLINTFLDNLRGILVSFTGSGKTVLGFGCISSFDNIKTVWLCHTIDLMNQAYARAKQYGYTSVGRYGGAHREINEDIIITTRQSFKKIADDYGNLFDMVVVDEVHHVSNHVSEYAYILSRLYAPIRLGLTATFHDDEKETEGYLTAVGLLGPVLEELTINDGAELGIVAKPTIKLLRLSKNHEIAELRKYADVYTSAIVERLDRNVLTAVTAKKHVENNETVLIMIQRIEHGKNIMAQLQALGVEVYFVRGSTDSDIREEIQEALNTGKIKCVICSSVWTEGVDIPSLNVVINAAGGKSDKKTMQSIGRGLRVTETKTGMYYYDFFDNSHRFLIEHFGERLCLYLDNGWI